MDFSRLRDEFLRHCQIKNLSPHTMRAYKQDLNDFAAWLAQHDGANAFSKDTVAGWLSAMRERGLSPASIKRRVACLKVLCRWLEESAGLETSPFRGWRTNIRMRKRLPKNLSRTELKAVLGLSRKDPFAVLGFNAATLKLALELLFCTAIRVGELCSITLASIDLAHGTIAINGKGNRERQVFLVDDRVVEFVRHYLGRRQAVSPKTEALLVTTRGAPLTPDAIRRRLRRHAEKMGLERRVTPHMFRHTAATELLESGVDIRFVQKLLGHASISTTEIYTHVSNRSLKEAIRTANPRARLG
jgi:site-specific recombinase XerD